MSTATDERVALDVDLTAILPCNIALRGCAREAVWALTCPICRYELYACDRHRRGMDEAVGRLVPNGHVPACSGCVAPYPVPLVWRSL